MPSRLSLSFCLFLLLISGGRASVTVHHQASPPPVPSPTVLMTIPINLQNSGTPNLSIKQKGSFIGFSIETSVANQVLGKNSTLIQAPFLNLMANIQQRAGSVMIRVGGNTQESAKLVPDDTIPNGRVLTKKPHWRDGRDATPSLEFSRDLLMMRNVSSFVNVHWFMGIPWFVTQPFNNQIITAVQEILGDYLLGLQAGNKSDMYHIHGHRPDTCSPYSSGQSKPAYLGSVAANNADPSGRAMKSLVGPNIADFLWTMEQVWDSGFIDKFHNDLTFLAVEKIVTDPQTIFPLYLTHDAHINLLKPYLNSIRTIGANTVISMTGATMLSSVKVKYLAASTVVQKGGYTWAGQTFGKNFEEDVKTVNGTHLHGRRPRLQGRTIDDFPDDSMVSPLVLSTTNGYKMAAHELAGTSKPPSAAPRIAQTSLVLGVLVSVIVGQAI
ncbi:Glyco-hydro-79C domain-containing protein [Mycena venus]|uniref:Glyco-hydro-79C domain-containing protein n=1 Tax=Mycena venus TaxID=2733690 RepID=A0A8H6XKR6_9AGAR|nr:Glyco-hydro-79C domain-containing protein [Mycena venus]